MKADEMTAWESSQVRGVSERTSAQKIGTVIAGLLVCGSAILLWAFLAAGARFFWLKAG